MQTARPGDAARGRMPTLLSWRRSEWRAWTAAQLVVSAAMLAVLAWAGVWFWRAAPDLPIEKWQRQGFEFLLIAGLVGFAVRSIVLLARMFGAPPRY